MTNTKTINEHDQLRRLDRFAFQCRLIREAGIIGLILFGSLWLMFG